MNQTEKEDLLFQIVENNNSIIYYASRMTELLGVIAYSLAARRSEPTSENLDGWATMHAFMQKRGENEFSRHDFYSFAFEYNHGLYGIDVFNMWFDTYLHQDLFCEFDFKDFVTYYKFYPKSLKKK